MDVESVGKRMQGSFYKLGFKRNGRDGNKIQIRPKTERKKIGGRGGAVCMYYLAG